MNDFTYYTPTKIFFGKNKEELVGEIIKNYGYKKVLLHYGKSSIKKSGLYNKVIESLKKANIEFVELSGVDANPKLSMVKKGIKIVKEENIDFILAVGGGSVIDSAKLIADVAKTEFDPWEVQTKKIQIDINKAMKIGVILTIAAAGSEMSDSCVITNEETLEKRGNSHESHRPLFAILNPELTYSVDKFQTGCGIVDIMMHTLERYYSMNDDTNFIDNLDLGLLKSVKEAGIRVIKDPYDYNARADLMWASSISHNNLTGTGKEFSMPVHQIEHELSGMYDNIAHGAGLSVLFLAWAKFVYKSDLNRFGKFATAVMDVTTSLDIETQAYEGIIKLEKFFKEIGMPTRLEELGVNEKDFEQIAYNYTFKGTRVVKDRISIGYSEALEILKLAK